VKRQLLRRFVDASALAVFAAACSAERDTPRTLDGQAGFGFGGASGNGSADPAVGAGSGGAGGEATDPGGEAGTFGAGDGGAEAGGGAGASGIAGSGGAPGGGNAGSGGAVPASCGLKQDRDRSPRVRLLNAHSSRFRAKDEATSPALSLRLRVNGAPLASLAPVPQQSSDSVSAYAEITEGSTVFGVQASNTSGDSLLVVDLATSTPVEKGQSYTVISLGDPLIDGSSSEIGPGLVVLKDDLEPAPCDRARMYFYQADTDLLVVDPVANAAVTQSLYVGTQSSSVAVAEPLKATPVGGLEVALDTTSFRLIAKDSATAQPTGAYPFTAPSDLLLPGRSYYVLSYPNRARTDSLGERLMFLPIGDDTPSTLVALNPLIVFVNVAPLPAAANLDVLGDAGRARNLLYLGSDQAKPQNSPTGGLSYGYQPPSGGALSFSSASAQPGTPLLTANTGPLQAGQMYLGVLSQAPDDASSALALSLRKIELEAPAPLLLEPTGPDHSVPAQQQTIFVNGCKGSPALDFGSFIAKPDQPGQTQFSPVIRATTYGDVSDTRTTLLPIASLEPLLAGHPEGPFGARVGVQAGSDLASNLSCLGQDSAFPRSQGPFVYVAVGDWSSASGAQLLRIALAGVATARVAQAVPLTTTFAQ